MQTAVANILQVQQQAAQKAGSPSQSQPQQGTRRLSGGKSLKRPRETASSSEAHAQLSGPSESDMQEAERLWADLEVMLHVPHWPIVLGDEDSCICSPHAII